MICEFVYSPKFFHNPKIEACGAFMAIHKHTQSGKNLNPLKCIFPAKVEQSVDTLTSYFSSHTVNTWSYFAFWCFLLVILLFKMTP